MRRMFLVLVFLLMALSASHAQSTETPAAFDTAGRIISVNPALAARLGLTAPAWPVTGSFVEARLFRVSDGGYVIVAQGDNGLNSRYPLTTDQAASLRRAFSEATDRVGRVVVEDAPNIVSEQARRPFVRDQMLLATIIYGSAVGTLVGGDEASATSAYLLTVGGTFFALNSVTRTLQISKAQNNLSTDGALRGWAFTAATVDALGADLSDKGTAATALIGGIGGSMIGFNRGRTMTNSEAQAAMTGSTLAAATAIGLAATTGLISEDNESSAPFSASFVAGGIAGYLVGPAYPRRAGYTVTAGDISVVRLGSLLGALAALTPIVNSENIDGRVGAGVLTAGWIGGAIVADRIGAKPFNHSASDARMIQLGALGGALMGLAFPVMVQADDPVFITGIGTVGAIAGAVITQRMMDPLPQGAALGSGSGGGGGRGRRLEFSPEAVAMTLTKQPGNHSLLRIRF